VLSTFLSMPGSCIKASQSNNKSHFSNKTGCPAEEHSRCLQMVTIGVKHISCEPELSLWASLAVASQSTITGNNASNETKLIARECYVVFTVPCVAACAVILLQLFCALSDLRAQAREKRPQSCWDDSWRCLHSHHLFCNMFKDLAAH